LVYRDEIDAGTIIDPTGKYKSTAKPEPNKVDLSNPPNIVIAFRIQCAARPRPNKLNKALEEAELRWLGGVD
jgi:hypothetical protein